MQVSLALAVVISLLGIVIVDAQQPVRDERSNQGSAPNKLDELRRAAMNRGGDAAKGEELFASELLKCGVCHKVHGHGGDAGPDLSQVAGKLDRTHLIESLLDPSAQVLEGFRTTLVTLADGRVLAGLVIAESPKEFVLIDAKNAKYEIGVSAVVERKTSNVSLMPTDIASLVSPASPGESKTFATGLRRPVDLRFGPDGTLYVLCRNAWVIDEHFQHGTGSLLAIRYQR